ncbi:hypothetical protein Patl1_29784 [Pistacia atlantica]|uniref:Uncharacterized protein n=1 Tax=Pistacia atlantica TaxID=434234 RepID=A0ACC1ADM0_9ROSI|nr:hypothetical protein Patl1_29784 [Pistacia atlantica]
MTEASDPTLMCRFAEAFPPLFHADMAFILWLHYETTQHTKHHLHLLKTQLTTHNSHSTLSNLNWHKVFPSLSPWVGAPIWLLPVKFSSFEVLVGGVRAVVLLLLKVRL